MVECELWKRKRKFLKFLESNRTNDRPNHWANECSSGLTFLEHKENNIAITMVHLEQNRAKNEGKTKNININNLCFFSFQLSFLVLSLCFSYKGHHFLSGLLVGRCICLIAYKWYSKKNHDDTCVFVQPSTLETYTKHYCELKYYFFQWRELLVYGLLFNSDWLRCLLIS